MKITTIDRKWGALALTQEASDHAATLRCTGRLVAGREAAGLTSAVQSQTLRDLVIDLGEISAIDAGGLGTLVALHGWAAISGKRLTLMNPSRRVHAVIERTGLAYLLDGGRIGVGRFEPAELCRCSA